MAGGGVYDPTKFTVANNSIKLGTKVWVCNLSGTDGPCVVARVMDRMSKRYPERIDLSEAVARAIGVKGKGRVEVTAVGKWDDAKPLGYQPACRTCGRMEPPD
jgi:rare lipoprotein A (peptidoglycan hydrolase)